MTVKKSYMENKLNIFVVDDHELFRQGVMASLKLLEYDLNIYEASNGADLLKSLEQIEPNIILMDINMPKINGIDATKMALLKWPKVKVIALSMQANEEYLENMLQAGVQGFLTKSIDKDDLSRAIKVVLEGKQYFSEELLPFFTQKYTQKPHKKKSSKLSKREIEILQLISFGLTNQEIATKLFLSVRTVSNHRTNLLNKTKTKNTATLIAYAIKNNLVEL